MPMLAVAADFHADHHAPLALEADGRVHRYAVQPGEEQRVTLETVEGLVRVEESLLNHVLGILSVINEAVNTIVQSLLITADQLPKGGRVALQTISDEALVVGAHGSLPLLDEGGAAKVPERRTRQAAPCAADGVPGTGWRAMKEGDPPRPEAKR